MIKREHINKDMCKEQILQKVEDFVEKVKIGTSDPEDFLTMSEIEHLWSELRKDTDDLYTELLAYILSSVNESELIRKKKQNTNK